MIDPIMSKIVPVMQEELARAQHDHGQTYASMHEAFGVLSEELHEAGIEYRELTAYEGMLIGTIHKGNGKLLLEELSVIHNRALQAACELVQVAAVAQKAIITLNDKGIV
jgi:hypothetical protein